MMMIGSLHNIPVTRLISLSCLLLAISCTKDSGKLSGNAAPANSVVIVDIPDTTITLDIANNMTLNYNIDVDQDNSTDFFIDAYSSTVQCVHGTQQIYSFTLNTNTPNNRVLDLPAQWKTMPGSGYTFDANSLNWNTYCILGDAQSYPPQCIGTGGYYYDANSKYIGIKLYKNNNYYYGWILVDWKIDFSPLPPACHLTLKKFAYNTIPNAGVVTP